MCANEVESYYRDIKDVVRNTYCVASYQRGYRWNVENVKELLDDIYEGKLVPDSVPDTKYCLQPLVIKRMEEQDKYRVLDGQQRLTTLFIILKALENLFGQSFPAGFSIEYRSRPRSKEFLDKLDDNSVPDNIDAAYIKKAYEFAKNWFMNKTAEFAADPETYAATKPHAATEPHAADPDGIDPALGSRMFAILMEKTCFIWDEIDAASKENEQKIFADRNTGKLDLTDSELIKSLFMNPDYYGGQRNDIRDRQTLISEIWDIYENELHKDDLWAFLPLPAAVKDIYANRTRIDAVFHMLVKKEKKTIRSEENGLFKAVQEWIFEKRREAKTLPAGAYEADPMAGVMHQCWREVCDLIDGIRELFDHNELYNLLSLYKIIAGDDDTVLSLYLDMLDLSKNTRADEIKRKIRERLFPLGISRGIKAVRYPDDRIKNILSAHNVAVMNTRIPN